MLLDVIMHVKIIIEIWAKYIYGYICYTGVLCKSKNFPYLVTSLIL